MTLGKFLNKTNVVGAGLAKFLTASTINMTTKPALTQFSYWDDLLFGIKRSLELMFLLVLAAT
jgi:hypothetical protein